MGLFLEIITPSRVLLQEEVEMVEAKGVLGEFGILPGHEQFLTLLDIGELRYVKDGKIRYIASGEGVMEVMEDKVLCLLDTAEFAEEIDVERVKQIKEDLEKVLKTISIEDPEYRKYKKELKKAINMISVRERI